MQRRVHKGLSCVLSLLSADVTFSECDFPQSEFHLQIDFGRFTQPSFPSSSHHCSPSPPSSCIHRPFFLSATPPFRLLDVHNLILFESAARLGLRFLSFQEPRDRLFIASYFSPLAKRLNSDLLEQREPQRPLISSQS